MIVVCSHWLVKSIFSGVCRQVHLTCSASEWM
uniref:Uncharacterized protein n=1 Tax=Anguilla anguilla TaxID=7936 RepID=A0A0E9V5W2_ANGAN